MDLELEPGEVKVLPERKHSSTTPLVARTDATVGTDEILLVILPGKAGLKAIPYGAKFLGYSPEEVPIFEFEDGSTTTWHEPEPVEEPAPASTTPTSTTEEGEEV